MAENEIRFLGNLQRLDLKPGDKFVLQLDSVVCDGVHQHIQQAWQEFIGHENAETVRLLIIDDGMKLGVIGTSAVRQPETVQ